MFILPPLFFSLANELNGEGEVSDIFWKSSVHFFTRTLEPRLFWAFCVFQSRPKWNFTCFFQSEAHESSIRKFLIKSCEVEREIVGTGREISDKRGILRPASKNNVLKRSLRNFILIE